MTGLVDEGAGANPVCLEFSKDFVSAPHVALTCHMLYGLGNGTVRWMEVLGAQQHHKAWLKVHSGPLCSVLRGTVFPISDLDDGTAPSAGLRMIQDGVVDKSDGCAALSQGINRLQKRTDRNLM